MKNETVAIRHRKNRSIYTLTAWATVTPTGQPSYDNFLAWMVKNLPAIQKTQIRSQGWEEPLEEGMATHSSILAWRIPWTEEPGRLQSMGSWSQTQLSN